MILGRVFHQVCLVTLDPNDGSDAEVIRKPRENDGDFFAEGKVYDCLGQEVLGDPFSDDVTL